MAQKKVLVTSEKNVPKTTAHVFSKARVVIVDSRKSFSDMGFLERPYSEQSACVQNVGKIIIFAPTQMSDSA